MHRLFGRKTAKEPPPTLENAQSSINARTSDIDGKIKSLDKELLVYREQLKKATGSATMHIKKRAMDTLKRKKMYENQRDQLNAQGFNIDQTAFAIDTVKNAQTTVAAMKAATKTLKAENKKIDLNDLENMQDDLEDLLEDTHEVSDILGRSYGVGEEIGDDDLEAELACLEDELESDELASEEKPAYLQPLPEQPSAPISAPASIAQSKAGVDEFGLPLQHA